MSEVADDTAVINPNIPFAKTMIPPVIVVTNAVEVPVTAPEDAEAVPVVFVTEPDNR